MTTTLVTGPPCAGKSTYVEARASSTALIICWDSIAREHGAPTHPTPRRMARFLMAEYDRQLAHVPHVEEAWVIRTLMDPKEREEWRARLDATLVVLAPPLDVLYSRASQRRYPARTYRDIDRWFVLNPSVEPRSLGATPTFTPDLNAPYPPDHGSSAEVARE